MFNWFRDPSEEDEGSYGLGMPSPNPAVGQRLIGVKTPLGFAQMEWTPSGKAWLAGKGFRMPMEHFGSDALEPVYEGATGADLDHGSQHSQTIPLRAPSPSTSIGSQTELDGMIPQPPSSGRGRDRLDPDGASVILKRPPVKITWANTSPRAGWAKRTSISTATARMTNRSS